MKALVLAESRIGQRELCAGARSLADSVSLVVVKDEPETGIADKAYRIALPDSEAYENASESLQNVYDAISPDVVLIEPTPRMKILGGTLAAKAGASVVAGVTSLQGDEVESLYFGGLATKKNRVKTPVAFYLLKGSAFKESEPTGTSDREEIAYIAPAKPITVRASKELSFEGVDLTRCDVVVGAGRGFAAEEDLELARQLTATLKGGLGCTRPLAESVKWMQRNLYMGVSGLMLSPKVYVAVGISGQMQHMVGVSHANTIIAINKDANAPIFKQADIGIVGDLYKVLPALIEKLN